MKPIRWIAASLLSVALFSGCAHIGRTERNTLTAHCVAPSLTDRMVRGDVLTLSDVIELSQRNVPEQLTINYLYSTRAVYYLDKGALARLNKAKVPQAVIDYLLQTPSMFGPRAYAGPYPYDPYYPYPCYGPYYGPYWGPYWGPSGVVVVRGGWGGHWRHH